MFVQVLFGWKRLFATSSHEEFQTIKTKFTVDEHTVKYNLFAFNFLFYFMVFNSVSHFKLRKKNFVFFIDVDFQCLSDPNRELYSADHVVDNWKQTQDIRRKRLKAKDKKTVNVLIARYFASYPCLVKPLAIVLVIFFGTIIMLTF